MEIALIADSHLSERAPECVSNWGVAARTVAAADPDLTIHLGDITLDGCEQPDELQFARGLLQAWPTPIVCTPGNHDMGTAGGEERLSRTALSRYTAAFGADRWCLVAGGWTLIGINAQLFGTGSTEERAQLEWLRGHARRLRRGDRVALFLHRPLLRPIGDASMRIGRYVHAESARWLLDGPLRGALRLVVSGHTHQAMDFVANGVRHVWVPSSGFVISDALQGPVGQKAVGIGWLSLSAGDWEYMHLTPPGAVKHELTGLSFYRELVSHT
ncbi:MAG TPA: metallophosphoesterase [Burkholderiaceae bacterium]|nr:metallophosphoesterase [Burkholderiaceae bacterium]